MSAEVRSWRLHMHIGYTFTEFARWINPIVRGWMQVRIQVEVAV